MPKDKKVTIGQIIRRIRANEIAPVYSLFGGDPFLEDYFVDQLSSAFLMNSGQKQYFS